jgi:hypothetical protein
MRSINWFKIHVLHDGFVFLSFCWQQAANETKKMSIEIKISAPEPSKVSKHFDVFPLLIEAVIDFVFKPDSPSNDWSNFDHIHIDRWPM